MRDILKRLIAQYGIQLCYDSQRVEDLLWDYCGQYRREINVLATAARQMVPEELLKLSDTSMDALIVHRLAQRLYEDVGLDKEFALWAVNTWAVALGKADSDIASPVHVKETATASTSMSVTVASASVGNWFMLEEAVKNARSGETLHLRAGIYTLTNTLNINKSLNIKGEGMDETGVIGATRDCVIKLEGNCKWNIQDVTFEYCGTEDKADVLSVSGGVVDIRRCSFIGAKGGSGLLLDGHSTGVVIECNISGNRVGIGVVAEARPLLEGNRCQDNGFYGIYYGEPAAGTARNNECTGNNEVGISVYDRARPILKNNRER